MSTLFEISERYAKALEFLADAEDIPQVVIDDTLEGMEYELEEKVHAVAAFIKNLEAEASAVDEHIGECKARHKALTSKCERLRAYLVDTVHGKLGMEQFKYPEFAVRFRKNPPAVVVLDESAIPPEFWKIETIRRLDKALVREFGGCEGAEIKTSFRVEIK